MPKRKLTTASVARVKPPEQGQVEYFDQGHPGLALRVSYAGARSWSVYYRIGHGKLRRKCLGKWPEMGLVEARDAWRDLRQNVAKGIDPAGDGHADTFAAVAAEWIRRDQSKNKASTLRAVTRTVESDLLPVWGARRVDTIGKRDVIELLDQIMDRGKTVKARRTHAMLHRFFRWSIGREILTVNPMVGLERPGSETPRERVLTDDELAAVWNACAEGPYGAAARLLLLTGARNDEISRLKWAEIVDGEIKLDGDRTKSGKPHTITLSAPARSLLESVPSGEKGDFVFSVNGGRSPITGWSIGKARIVASAKINPWRIHDLRRTVATGLQKLGVNLQVIEAVLGHVSGSRRGVVGIYQRHSFDAEKRAALEAWGAHIIGLVEGRAPGKVVPLRGAK
jgi:integrase